MLKSGLQTFNTEKDLKMKIILLEKLENAWKKMADLPSNNLSDIGIPITGKKDEK